ncbi:MAG: KH domain-containing protein [Candidatus Levybacteria bacterium]|nr:KH domain-containing protein [Candidatus Levybacteria bacterium]
MKDALYFIIKNIVEKEKEVDILEEENQGIVNFTVKVSQDEIGKVIGKDGKVIRAIRNIMRIPAVSANKKIYISLSEN